MRLAYFLQERMWKIAMARHLAYAALEHWKMINQAKSKLKQGSGTSSHTVDKIADEGAIAHSKESIEKDCSGATDAMEVDTDPHKDEDPSASPNGMEQHFLKG